MNKKNGKLSDSSKEKSKASSAASSAAKRPGTASKQNPLESSVGPSTEDILRIWALEQAANAANGQAGDNSPYDPNWRKNRILLT